MCLCLTWGVRKANVKVSEIDQENCSRLIMKNPFSLLSVKSMMHLAVRQNIGDRLSAQKRLVEATNTTYKLSNARFRAGIDSYLTIFGCTACVLCN